jgi:hypothetical protein
MNAQEEWDAAVDGDEWILLSHDHPDYSIQQEFCEVAVLTRETDPDKLFALALADYEGIVKADDRIRKAFRKWAVVQASRSASVKADPYMMGLEAAEEQSPEAADQFMKDNPHGPFKPLGK